MAQHRLCLSHFILVAHALIGILCFGSFAKATDLTISDSSPLLIFSDTSGTPYQWQILGDHVDFSVQDFTASTVPFRIDPGAPTSSLFIDSTSRIGMGTSTPFANLHIRTPDTFPSLRFESTSAFPHVWEVEAGAAGFSLIDNGSASPFAVFSGAPANSLIVNSDGNVGFGTQSPTAPIHVKKEAQEATAEILARFVVSDDATGSLVVSNNSAGDGLFIPKITARSASQNAALINEALITNDVGGSPAIVYNAALGAGGALVTRPLVVYRNNSVAKVTIAANGVVSATSFNPVSSRSLKHDIVDLDSQKAFDALRQLTPVEFVYNDDETQEKRVGFIAEDVPEIVANPDRQSVPIMDVVALVTRVVKDQQKTIENQRKVSEAQRRAQDEQQAALVEQRKLIERQQATIGELMRRLEVLEKR